MCKNIKRTVAIFTIMVLITLYFELPYQQVFAFDKDSLNDIYVSENNYEDKMKEIVEPYIDNIKETGYIPGQDGVNIYYEMYKSNNSKANIVISHGFSESLEKYNEIIYYFLNQGYSVFGLEHRGHGRSGSLGVKDKSQINVKDFENYVLDLKELMDEVVIPKSNGKKIFLFAHSMGGGIGSKFLEEYPEYFHAVVLTSPMLEINTGKVPEFIVKLIANTSVALSFGDRYIAGEGKYKGIYDLKGSDTSSDARYRYYYNIVKNNEDLQRGGASYNWLQASIYATEEITSKDNASKVEIPVMLMQADKDDFVKSGGQNKFKKYAKDCNKIFYEGSKHGLFRERDELLRGYLNNVFTFYEENL
ncbi:alpha/beta fold hydrolase [Clostridium taeniosporum]|uniref:Alpha/beta hydrolase n=1 Tax=Clostridium taeniosporum TaxID=394958 RepID=A0A1D7XKI5_9CLOT|nr:alpha/beta hydrolase [Clostridium taeniosporum]AOR23846.1 alpha/beta hydrolase [Clostridium taeniosporum]